MNLQIQLLTLLLFSIFKFQLLFLSFIYFKGDGFYNTTARVIAQYKKNNHYVLKLKNRHLTFYTTSKDNLKNLLNEKLSLTLITKNVSFIDYLTTFYAPSFNLKLLPISKVEEFIEKQHKDKEMQNIFKALFLGESLDYQVRKELSTLGIAHLLALSGLHLGVISAILFFVFSPIYKFFQQRYFSYRNRFFDLGVIILVIEFIYLVFTSFPPSLIRAFVLEVILFIFAIYFYDILSIYTLLILIGVSFLIFDFRVFSIGFLLSILGVFYIYLFFRYFKVTVLSTILLSFYMYLVMNIYSHYFFGNFNLYQLLSPITNLIFPVFYIIEIALHLIGFGFIFDNLIKEYLFLGDNYIIIKFNFWFVGLFFVLSIVAFFNKKAFYGINLLSIAASVYLVKEFYEI